MYAKKQNKKTWSLKKYVHQATPFSPVSFNFSWQGTFKSSDQPSSEQKIL